NFSRAADLTREAGPARTAPTSDALTAVSLTAPRAGQADRSPVVVTDSTLGAAPAARGWQSGDPGAHTHSRAGCRPSATTAIDPVHRRRPTRIRPPTRRRYA